MRETYGLFLHHCINRLAIGGRLVFIVPDTFLYLHLHEGLRQHILKKTLVEEIVIFPSRFFKGISFGYANMSIVTLTSARGQDTRNHSVRVIRNLTSPEDLSHLAQNSGAGSWITSYVNQSEISKKGRSSFVLSTDVDGARYVGNTGSTIGDIADVVTGFYSGNDRRWLRAMSNSVRGAWRYETIDPELIARHPEDRGNALAGLSGPDFFIPIVKGGARSYVKPTEWYVDWSIGAVDEYRKPRPNKARFQNSRYYFREGIAVPMVSSKRVTAALLEKRLFDQSIVGVFPHDLEFVFYLLGFFNSGVCTRLLRSINPSANNSANYIKRLPFIVPDDDSRKAVSSLVKKVVASLREGDDPETDDQRRIDELFEQIYDW